MGRVLRWLQLIGLTLLVLLGVSSAYLLSDNPQPLEGLATFGSLLLTVYLVFIYRKQNEILERHEDVLEDQFEAQEAAELQPHIHVEDWRIRGSNLKINMENTGEGDIYQLCLFTEIDLEGEPGSSMNTWKSNLTHHFTSGYSRRFEKKLRFHEHTPKESSVRERLTNGIKDLRRGKDHEFVIDEHGSEGESFQELSIDLLSDSDYEEVTLPVRIFLAGKDARGEPVIETLSEDEIRFSKVSSIRKSLTEEGISTSPQTTNIQVQDVGIPNHEAYTLPDELFFDVKNMGNMRAHLQEVKFKLRVFDDGWKDLEEHFDNSASDIDFSPNDTEIDKDLQPYKSEALSWNATFTFDGETKSFSEFTAELSKTSFDNPLILRYSLRYEDRAGIAHSQDGNVLEFRLEDSEEYEDFSSKTFGSGDSLRDLMS